MTKKGGVREKKQMIDSYKPYDPDEYVITVADPINLLGTQSNAKTLREAMALLSSEYAIHFRDVCGYTFFLTQQQAADSEDQQFNYKGNIVVEKLYPTLANLGDNRTTQRDADIVLGLFSPARSTSTIVTGKQ